MTKKKKKKNRVGLVIIVLLLIALIVGVLYYKSRPKLQVVSVVSEIEGYNYKLEDNATSIYKKTYKELEKELKNKEIDEENYAKLVAKLFVIDYYTLNNKITNKDIGGDEFIHSSLKDKFIKEASESIYKYVENDLYGDRKQKLPEVKSVSITDFETGRYRDKGFNDDNAYEVVLDVSYKKDYDYPNKISLILIHDDNKLGIVEIK